MSYQPRITWSLVEPPPAVEAAPDLLALAVAALEAKVDSGLGRDAAKKARRRQLGVAHAYARAVDWTAMEWFWIEGGLEWERRHDKDAHTPSSGQRAGANIPAAVKRAVAARDGYRCRYCQLRVITSATLTKLERLLPAALPLWPAEMGPAEVVSHASQSVMRLTWDHVRPRSLGGSNTEENIVTSCGGCNYNKGSCTIEELSLRDPFDRPPKPAGAWDGLDARLGSRAV